MSFGTGHVTDMINRMKQNRALRPSNKSTFKQNSLSGVSSVSKESERTNFRTIPHEKLIDIKRMIRQRAAVQRRKELLFYVLLLTCGLVLITGTLFWLNR